jgi:hypothetical protein
MQNKNVKPRNTYLLEDNLKIFASFKETVLGIPHQKSARKIDDDIFGPSYGDHSTIHFPGPDFEKGNSIMSTPS